MVAAVLLLVFLLCMYGLVLIPDEYNSVSQRDNRSLATPSAFFMSRLRVGSERTKVGAVFRNGRINVSVPFHPSTVCGNGSNTPVQIGSCVVGDLSGESDRLPWSSVSLREYLAPQ